MNSILYLAAVGVLGLGLVRGRLWRMRGWLAVVGAVLGLPAKLPLGIVVPTNSIWTGIAFMIWPIAVGIGLLRYREEADATPDSS